MSKFYIIQIVVIMISIISCPVKVTTDNNSGDVNNKEHELSFIWTEYNKTGSTPHNRYNFDMAYAGGTSLVLFGGFYSTPTTTMVICNDTWIYDIGTHLWTEWDRTGKTEGNDYPNGRVFHSMAYLGDDRVLLFGGQTSPIDPSTALCDTWIFDISEGIWEKWDITGKTEGVDYPELRSMYNLSYAGDDKALLFGGLMPESGGGTVVKNDTWEFDMSEGTWTEYNTTGTFGKDRPYGICDVSMAYGDNSKIVLFGKFSSTIETWIYDASVHIWSKWDSTGKTEGMDFPEGRRDFKMASFMGFSTIMLFGGYLYLSGEPASDTWIFEMKNEKWVRKNTFGTEGSDFPVKRYSHAACYVGNYRIILFGGCINGNSFSNEDTWEYR